MLRSIFVFIIISLMTFVLQYWFVSRLGYPETFATTCQDYTREFLPEARCEYTFNMLSTTVIVAFLALFPFIISQNYLTLLSVVCGLGFYGYWVQFLSPLIVLI